MLKVSTPQIYLSGYIFVFPSPTAWLAFIAIFGRDAIKTPPIALMADVNNIFDNGSHPVQILQQIIFDTIRSYLRIWTGWDSSVRWWWSTSLPQRAWFVKAPDEYQRPFGTHCQSHMPLSAHHINFPGNEGLKLGQRTMKFVVLLTPVLFLCAGCLTEVFCIEDQTQTN